MGLFNTGQKEILGAIQELKQEFRDSKRDQDDKNSTFASGAVVDQRFEKADAKHEQLRVELAKSHNDVMGSLNILQGTLTKFAPTDAVYSKQAIDMLLQRRDDKLDEIITDVRAVKAQLQANKDIVITRFWDFTQKLLPWIVMAVMASALAGAKLPGITPMP
jgi:hypothetical protein